MTVTVSLPDDTVLDEFSESELRLEMACSMYASRRISRKSAAALSGIGEEAFDNELMQRKISAYTDEMLKEDLQTLEHLDSK